MPGPGDSLRDCDGLSNTTPIALLILCIYLEFNSCSHRDRIVATGICVTAALFMYAVRRGRLIPSFAHVRLDRQS